MRSRSVRWSCCTRRGEGGDAAASRPSGKVSEDGTFQLTTYEAGDGAPAGEYTATLQWNKLVKRGNDFVAGPDIVPPAYTSPEQSPGKRASGRRRPSYRLSISSDP
ncbi:MAG: hypothetical protein U0835_12120 [Isosphaeraceae bacterium]